MVSEKQIEAAYKRGANWVMENIMFLNSPDIARMLDKAAYDYADKTFSEAALSTDAEPVQSRNDEAGFVEFLNEDVPYIVRDINGRVAILTNMETRNIIGYRVYDPALVALSHTAPPAHQVGASETEKLSRINAALDAIRSTCFTMERDDRHLIGRETISQLRDAAKLINELVFQSGNQSAPQTQVGQSDPLLARLDAATDKSYATMASLMSPDAIRRLRKALDEVSPPDTHVGGERSAIIAALQEWSDQKFGSPFSVSACHDLLDVLPASQVGGIDADKIAKAIVLAACELDDLPDPDDDDTLLITIQDLEAVAHRHITVAIERADPASYDHRKIADLMKALSDCRSNICGYSLSGSYSQAEAAVVSMYYEIKRIDQVARAALAASEGGDHG